MTNFRKGALALVAATGAVWLAGAPPAWADDESDAKQACKEIASEYLDWDESNAKVTRESENRIVVAMKGEVEGETRERRCVYDTKSEEASFQDKW